MKKIINFDSIHNQIYEKKNIYLSIEKYLNETNNYELKDKSPILDFFYTSWDKKNKQIERIITHIDKLTKIQNPKIFYMPKNGSNNNEMRQLDIYDCYDEIAIIACFIPLANELNDLRSNLSYSNILSEYESENLFDDFTYQYKSYIEEKNRLMTDSKYNAVLYFDIENFYPNCKNIGSLFIETLKKRFTVVGDGLFYKDLLNQLSIHGLPQGLSICSIISESILYSFDESLKNVFPNYEIIRYADDYIIYIDDFKGKNNYISVIENLLIEGYYKTNIKINVNKKKVVFKELTNELKENYKNILSSNLIETVFSTFEEYNFKDKNSIKKYIEETQELNDINTTRLFDLLILDDEKEKIKFITRNAIFSSLSINQLKDNLTVLINKNNFFSSYFRNYLQYIFSYSINKNYGVSEYLSIMKIVGKSLTRNNERIDTKYRKYFTNIFLWYIKQYKDPRDESTDQDIRKKIDLEKYNIDLSRFISKYNDSPKLFNIYNQIWIKDILDVSNSKFSVQEKSYVLSRDKDLMNRIYSVTKKLFDYRGK